MFVATFVVHFQNGFLWVKGGYEYPLMWMLIMIAITLRGGSTLSIDNQLPKRILMSLSNLPLNKAVPVLLIIVGMVLLAITLIV